VVRGGSWGYGQDVARAACPDYGYPYDRDFRIGFRLCCASPIL